MIPSFKCVHLLQIVNLISQALGDFTESEFLKSENIDVCKRNAIVDYFEKLSYLSGGSLLAHACKSIAILAGHGNYSNSSGDIRHCNRENDDILDCAFNIGKSIGIAFQVLSNSCAVNMKIEKELKVANYIIIKLITALTK